MPTAPYSQPWGWTVLASVCCPRTPPALGSWQGQARGAPPGDVGDASATPAFPIPGCPLRRVQWEDAGDRGKQTELFCLSPGSSFSPCPCGQSWPEGHLQLWRKCCYSPLLPSTPSTPPHLCGSPHPHPCPDPVTQCVLSHLSACSCSRSSTLWLKPLMPLTPEEPPETGLFSPNFRLRLPCLESWANPGSLSRRVLSHRGLFL